MEQFEDRGDNLPTPGEGDKDKFLSTFTLKCRRRLLDSLTPYSSLSSFAKSRQQQGQCHMDRPSTLPVTSLYILDDLSPSAVAVFLLLRHVAEETSANGNGENPNILSFDSDKMRITVILEDSRGQGEGRLTFWREKMGVRVIEAGKDPLLLPLRKKDLSLEKDLHSVMRIRSYLKLIKEEERKLPQGGVEGGGSALLLPDTRSTVTAEMFSLLALGRGGQVTEQMASSVLIAKDPDLLLLRPLLDFSSSDVAEFVRLSFQEGKEDFHNAEKSSAFSKCIQDICTSFTTKLDKTHAGTESTLFRISGKLEIPLTPRCPFCLRRTEKAEDFKEENTKWCYGCSNFLKSVEDNEALNELSKEKITLGFMVPQHVMIKPWIKAAF